jgi:hypothetical protein
MLTAIAVALMVPRHAEAVELWSVPFHLPNDQVYSSGSTSDGAKIAINSYGSGEPRRGDQTYVLDTVAHTVTPWLPYLAGGTGCGRGLVIVSSDPSGIGNTGNELFTITTYDLATRKKLSSIRIHRACNLIGATFEDEWHSGGPDEIVHYDALTGQRRVGLPLQYLDRFVTPVWDGNRCRLYAISSQPRPAGYDDRYLVRFNAGSNIPVGKAHLAQGYNPAVVGNPDSGVFAMLDGDGSGRFTWLSGVFRPDLTRVPVKVDWVSDVTSRGILGELGKRDGLGNWTFREMQCLSPVTGKLMWVAKNPKKGFNNARWIGRNVDANGEVFDGGSGRSVGLLDLPKGKDLNWHDDVVIRAEGSPTRRIAAYRVTGRSVGAP